jgi:hypothetical protein
LLEDGEKGLKKDADGEVDVGDAVTDVNERLLESKKKDAHHHQGRQESRSNPEEEQRRMTGAVLKQLLSGPLPSHRETRRVGIAAGVENANLRAAESTAGSSS